MGLAVALEYRHVDEERAIHRRVADTELHPLRIIGTARVPLQIDERNPRTGRSRRRAA